MNTIIIYDKDIEKMKVYEAAHRFENFIFNDFRLSWKHDGYKVVYKIHIEGNINEVHYRMIDGDSFKDCKFIFADEEEGVRFVQTPAGELVDILLNYEIWKKDSNEDTKNFIEKKFVSEASFICLVKQYIMNESYERKTIQKVSSVDKTNNVSGSRENRRVERKVVQFLLDDIIDYVSSSGRKHNVYCECWAVRGHFRHYKNGKVTWISSYEKGKQRNSGKTVGNRYVM